MAYTQVVASSAADVDVGVLGPGFSTLDGVPLTADVSLILLTRQNTPSENGVWLFKGSGTQLERPAAPHQYEIGNALDNATVVWVTGGTLRGGTVWGVDPAQQVVVDTTAHNLTRVSLPPVQCRCATTADINLASTHTSIDGVTLVGNGTAGSDIVLVKDQTTPAENGVYWANTGGAMVRCSEPLVAGRRANVSQGERNAHAPFEIVTQGAITPGATDIVISPQRLIFNVRDFGAVPDGTTPCDAAFAKMFEAMRAQALTFAGSRTSLAVAHLGQGAYWLDENLVLPGNCILAGEAGTAGGSTGATELRFAPGKCVVAPFNLDSRLGKTAGATLRDMTLFCLPFAAPDPEPTEWVPGNPYAVGDVVYLPHSREYIYECVTAGNSQSAPVGTTTWIAATPYAENELVVPPTLNGHYYRQINANGSSAGVDPFAPASRTWKESSRTPDGLLMWLNVGLWPGLAAASQTAVCVGVPSTHPTVRWTTGQNYNVGDVVFVPDGAGSIFTDAVYLLEESEQPSGHGGIAGAGPVAWDPTPGNTTDDGSLVWTAVDPLSFFFLDGTCVWVPRVHPGIYARSNVLLENLLISGPITAKVHIRTSNIAPEGNANDWRARNLTLESGSGPGFVVAGDNSNAGLADGIVTKGTTTDKEWDFAFRDGSLLGCTWVGCHVESAGGLGFVVDSIGESAFVGCYSEENGGMYSPRGVVIGGALAANPLLTENSTAVVLAGQASQNLLTVNTNVLNPDPENNLRVFMGSNSRTLRAFVPFGLYAEEEIAESGFAWSTELNRHDDLGYKLGNPGKDGWWIWGHNIHGQGTMHAAFAVSGPTADTLRDFAFGPAGNFWITQPYLFIGDTATNPNCLKLGTQPPATGDWEQGDIVWNIDPVSTGYAGWICTVAGAPGTWMKYAALESAQLELSLAASFTTTSDGATPTSLTFPVNDGEIWAIELECIAQCSSTGGVRYAVDAPGASAVVGWLDGTTTDLSTKSLEVIALPSTLTTTPVHTVAALPAPDRIVATITADGDGDVTILAASNTNGQTTTIFAGAILRARRVVLV